MEKGDFSKVIPYLNTEDIEFLDELLKSINYDREKECSVRRSGHSSRLSNQKSGSERLSSLSEGSKSQGGDPDENGRVARHPADEEEGTELKFSDGEGRDICKRFWYANSDIEKSKEFLENIKKFMFRKCLSVILKGDET